MKSPRKILLIAFDNSSLQMLGIDLCGADSLKPQLLTSGSAINAPSTFGVALSIGFAKVSYPYEELSYLTLNLQRSIESYNLSSGSLFLTRICTSL